MLNRCGWVELNCQEQTIIKRSFLIFGIDSNVLKKPQERLGGGVAFKGGNEMINEPPDLKKKSKVGRKKIFVQCS